MLANAVKETTSTAGTGTVTLSALTGYARFSAVFDVDSLVSYAIHDGDNWEWGLGTVGASNTLERTYISATLVSGTYTQDGATAITLASGAAEVFCSTHGGNWQGIGGAQRTDGDIYLFSHGAIGGALTTRAQGANEINYIQLMIVRPYKVIALGLNVTTAGSAGAKARAGIYRANADGSPGVLIVDAGEVAVDSTGLKESVLGTSIVLTPGLYWAAANASATATFRGLAYTMMPSVSMTSPAQTALYASLRTASSTYGALPDPAPTATDSIATVPAYVYVRGRNL